MIASKFNPQGTLSRRRVILLVLPMLLVLGQAFIWRSGVSGGVSASDPVRMVVLGLAYIIALGVAIEKYNDTFKIFWENPLIVAFLIYILVSMTWSGFPKKVLINWVHQMGICLVIISFLFCFGSYPDKMLRFFAFLLLMVTTCNLLVSILIPGFGVDPSGRWMGMTSHPNTLGYTCMLTVWSNLACFFLTKNKLIRVANFSAVGLSFICLHGSDSMTSTIWSLFIIYLMILLIKMDVNTSRQILIKAFSVLYMTALIVIFLYAFRPEMLTVSGWFDLMGRDEQLTGRTELWEKGFTLLRENPLVGLGFDSNATIFSKSVIKYGQFHNGYLDLLVSGGFVALILLLGIIIKFIWNALHVLKKDYSITIAMIILILAILAHNATEASLIKTTHPMWVLFLTAYFFVAERYRILKREALRIPANYHSRQHAY
jgi:exopolysaccharide production protein ExoQ